MIKNYLKHYLLKLKYNIVQLEYDSDGYPYYGYLCQKDDLIIGMTLMCKNKMPDIGDESNPVTGILDSVKS